MRYDPDDAPSRAELAADHAEDCLDAGLLPTCSECGASPESVAECRDASECPTCGSREPAIWPSNMELAISRRPVASGPLQGVHLDVGDDQDFPF